MELALAGLYSESAVEAGHHHGHGRPAVRVHPYRIMPDMHRPIYEEIARRDADLYRRLERAGFLLISATMARACS